MTPTTAQAHEAAFRDALAVEYAAGWPFYDRETSTRLAAEQVRLNIRPIMRALARADLKLMKVLYVQAPPFVFDREEDVS